MSLHSLETVNMDANGADSGLDNAGKTTIVKKIMGEDVNTVSPTLGFIIKTIDYEGWVVSKTRRMGGHMLIIFDSYKLNICQSFPENPGIRTAGC